MASLSWTAPVFVIFFGMCCTVTGSTDGEVFSPPSGLSKYMDENQEIFRNLLREISRVRENPPLLPSETRVLVEPQFPTAEPSIVLHRDARARGSSFYAPHLKRMRPCFYSPIQCLMKRSQIP